MGHEVLIFGGIEGVATERLGADNRRALAELPDEDEWPWLVREMFAQPASWPRGTYRSPVIHFGLSLKDEPGDRACWNRWLSKFETLLSRMYWWSATLHVVTEFEPERVYRWRPTKAAVERMAGDKPQPVGDWVRSVVDLPDE